MRRCPICESYMSDYIEYIYGSPMSIYTCNCGYSNKNKSYSTTNKTSTLFGKIITMITTNKTQNYKGRW